MTKIYAICNSGFGY